MDKKEILIIGILIFFIIIFFINITTNTKPTKPTKPISLPVSTTSTNNESFKEKMLVDDRKFTPDYSFMTNKVNYPPKMKEPMQPNPRNIENFKEYLDSNTLIFQETTDPHYFYPLEFPENTSYELKPFTSDTVTDMFSSDTISGLYDTINADLYRGYKNNEYML